MLRPYEPPRHLAHLAKTVNAARTQVGWGVHDDGSVGVEHIISSNPFAGKSKVWGIAEIDDTGDVQIISKGPGNTHLAEALPAELVEQLSKFYEREGLNVRNIGEFNPALDEKKSEIDQGAKACPHCGSGEVFVMSNEPHHYSDKAECESCGWAGDQADLINYGEDPDPDRGQLEEDEVTDNKDPDDWDNYVSKLKIVEAASEPFTVQGAPAGGNTPATGTVVRPDRQSREEIEKQMGGLEAAPTDQNYRDYIDTVSPPSGPPGGYYNNPYVNRGGSFLSESADDHFFETQKEAAPGDGPAPAGIPGAGPSDMRNFSPGNQPGFIVISQYLTPADNWLFTNKCSGIIAETGGTTSHGAVVARAMGIPAIVGAEDATRIQPGDTVTMDPNTGRIDVNGGDPSYEMGEVMRAANEVVRFVWSAGNAVYSPVTEELTEELAALPYNSVGEEDRSHAQMMEYMMMEDTYDFDDGTIGVIYDDGRAIYYEAITDAPALENWLRSNFPNLVNEVVYKQTAGGIYQPQAEPAMAHVAGEEDLEKAPECPNCGSHTYELISLPNDTRGPADLKCLACKTEFTHDVIRNPKQGDRRSEPGPYDRAPGPLPGDPCPECAAPITEVNGRFICPSCSWYLGVPEHTHIQEPYNFSSKLKIVEADGLGIVARCGNCGSEVNLGEVQQNDGDCPNCQMPLPLLDDLTPRTTMSQSIDEHFIEATEKEAGPVLDGIALAFSSALMGYGAGTAGVQLGTWLANKWVEAGYNRPPSEDEARSFASEYDNEFEYLDENGETKWNHGLYEASSDENLVLDTNGQPIHQGELYLMHSTKYPVPDLVRIVNITPQQIEAHIDSDESGTFPIEIHPAEYINLGYSFEPYEDVSKEASTKEALRHISVTPKRQQELINENMNGRARNFDKLNLDDTHYVPFHDLIPSSIGDEIDSHFMW